MLYEVITIGDTPQQHGQSLFILSRQPGRWFVEKQDVRITRYGSSDFHQSPVNVRQTVCELLQTSFVTAPAQ